MPTLKTNEKPSITSLNAIALRCSLGFSQIQNPSYFSEVLYVGYLRSC
jgi:hypothetical protein